MQKNNNFFIVRDNDSLPMHKECMHKIGWNMLFLFLLLPGCRRSMLQKKIALKPTRPLYHKNIPGAAPSITVWIHGTRFLSKPFFKTFFHCPQHLNPAHTFEHKYHLRKVAELLNSHDPHRFPLEQFYFFGWSGNLSKSARLEAARTLHCELTDLVTHYTAQYGQKPIIRIITHSHGGNVALNLAQFTQGDFTIAELILLACPVQKTTEHLINNPIFEKIYSLYSSMDSLQILDPQGLHNCTQNGFGSPLFSERRFKQHEKLAQVKLKIDGRGLLHVEFVLEKFISLLPAILNEINAWYNEHPDEGKMRVLSIKSK